jgi:hypothetical protein
LFIPPINGSLEGTAYLKWLRDRELAQERLNEEIRIFMARAARETSTGARQLANVNNNTRETAETVSSTHGLPPGGGTGSVVRKLSGADGHARWTYEWQGMMPEYWVSLNPAGASYFVSGLGLEESGVPDQDAAKRLLPPVRFADGGTTMLEIDSGNYSDGISNPLNGQNQSPIHLYVEVWPTEDGEEFLINMPTDDNSLGVTTPFYTFELFNPTAFEAVVNIEETRLYYAGTSIPVNGSETQWTLPPLYNAAWFVQNVKGYGTAVTPVRGFVTGESSDAYFDTHVAAMRHMDKTTYPGVLTTSTGGLRVTNDTIADANIGKITASVGTAPTGADIVIAVLKNGISITTSFTIAAGASSGTAVLSDVSLAPGDYLTFNVTQVGSTVAGSNLTIQTWFG